MSRNVEHLISQEPQGKQRVVLNYRESELKSGNCITIQTQGQQVAILTAQQFQEEAFKYHPVCKAECLRLLNSQPCYNQTLPTTGKALS